MDFTVKDRVLQIIEDKHKASGGSCGTYLKEISKQLNVPVADIEAIVVVLNRERLVQVRKGIHGYMLVKNCKIIKPNKS